MSLTEEYCTGGISQLFEQALDRVKEHDAERRVLERLRSQAMPQTVPMDQDSRPNTANTNHD